MEGPALQENQIPEVYFRFEFSAGSGEKNRLFLIRYVTKMPNLKTSALHLVRDFKALKNVGRKILVIIFEKKCHPEKIFQNLAPISKENSPVFNEIVQKS